MNFKVFLIRILILVITFSFLPSVKASASSQSYEFRLENWNDGGKQSLGQKNPYPFEQNVNLVIETNEFLPGQVMQYSFGLNGPLKEIYSTKSRIAGNSLAESIVSGTLTVFSVIFRCGSNEQFSGSRFYVINVGENTNLISPNSIKYFQETLDRQQSSGFSKRGIEYVPPKNPLVEKLEKRVEAQVKVPNNCASLKAEIEVNVFALKKDENNSTYVSLEITRPAGEGEYVGVNTNELVISAGKVEGTKGIESARKQLSLDLGSSKAKLSELDLERKKIFDVLSLDARFTSCKVSTSTELAMLNKAKSESQMKFGQISLFYPEIFEAWSRLLDRTIAYAAKGYSRGCSGADFMDGQDKLFNELLANKGNLYRESSPFFGPDGKAVTVLIDAASALSKEKSVTRSKAVTALEFFLNLQSMQKILNSPAITPTEQRLGRLADKDLKVAQTIAKKFTLKSAKTFNDRVSKKYADKACVLDTQFSERDFGVFSTAEKKTYLDNLCDTQRFISTRVKVLLLYFN
jgi:hypothetical protein